MRRVIVACLLAVPSLALCADAPSKEVVDAVKQATVLVQVEGANRKASGSGFVVKVEKDTLFIATNYHVLAGSNYDRRTLPIEANQIARADKVTLVFDSGTKTERMGKAQVIALDPDVDLAILRVSGFTKPPAPIGLANTAKPVETMTVYSFGFPFGTALGFGKSYPAITVGKAAISSLRLDDNGELSVIQIDGNLNPGNSGGPIVDEKGQLVGVAMSKVRDGQGIGFAIPAAELNRILIGGLGRPHLVALPGVDGRVTVKVEVGLIDPDSLIRSASLHYVVIAPKAAKPGPKDRLDKFAGAKRLELTIDGNVAVGQITLESPAGELFVQAACKVPDDKGFSAIRSVDLTAPAMLAAGKPPAGWKEYVAKGNEFSVWVPERAQRQSDQDRTTIVGGVRMRTLSLRVEMVGGVVYMADILTIPAGIVNHFKREDWERDFQQWVAKERDGKVVEDVEVQMGAIPGREYRIEAPGRASRARLFVIGDGKVVVLQMTGPAADLKDAGANMFFNSCRLWAGAGRAEAAPPHRPVAPPKRAVNAPRAPSVVSPPTIAERTKLPSAAERERATRLARDLFKEEFALTSAAAKAEFAAKLFQQASETDDDPAAQFVLYRESAEFAAAVDIELALRACDVIVRRFEGTMAEVLEPIIGAIAAKATTTEAASELATFIMKRIEEALTADDVDTAGRLHQIAEQCAQRSMNIKIARQAQALAGDIQALKALQGVLQAAQSVLKSNPNNEEANLVLGKHNCFLKGDWKTGLPMLAKSSDERLKQLATKELETSEDDRLAAGGIGDAWNDLLVALKDYPKTQIQLHIHALYSRALPAATGLTKTKFEKRLDELDNALQGKFEHAGLWPLVRAAVRDRTYDKTDIMGGGFADKDYAEIPADGGILIGFNYTYRRFGNKDSIDCFQPIYLTPSGERLGAAHGDLSGGKVMTLKAKPNYAIGKMAIRGGGLWGGTNVVFMRIDGKGLKASDSYESGWIGHTDQPNSPFLGDGRPIIGIFGKDQRGEVGICNIGFYLIGEKPTGSR